MAKPESCWLEQNLRALSTQQDQARSVELSTVLHIVKEQHQCEKDAKEMFRHWASGSEKKKTNKPLWNAAMFSFVYGINDGGVCLLKNQPLVIVRELHSECRLYWKLIASVQSEPHHKCHVEVAGSEEAMTALSALFHLKVGKTHCDRSALHQ